MGGKDDPRIAYYDHIYGEDFAFVARTMRRAKCVVTVNAFPGRLAHAAGIGPKHIGLDAPITSWNVKATPTRCAERVARRAAGDMED